MGSLKGLEILRSKRGATDQVQAKDIKSARRAVEQARFDFDGKPSVALLDNIAGEAIDPIIVAKGQRIDDGHRCHARNMAKRLQITCDRGCHGGAGSHHALAFNHREMFFVDAGGLMEKVCPANDEKQHVGHHGARQSNLDKEQGTEDAVPAECPQHRHLE
ncbi:hypothetical protein GCM10007898_27420 [Dyella flagellata]|uniref:Uncharacterized protein n=1 Tax=Dyella flagellata TaxID=1867833 RepID=A0ABQ5XBV1_9GAMM|nr:hypothetical protein GCM10007898_27420 [Dyella flagellata]